MYLNVIHVILYNVHEEIYLYINIWSFEVSARRIQ